MASNNSKQLFHAVVFDTRPTSPLSAAAAASEPLMNVRHDDDDGYANDYDVIRQSQPASATTTNTTPQNQDFIFQRFKLSALFIGLIVGIFIQFSTLGANFLVINLWGGGADLFSKASQQQVVLFSLLWSFLTSATAIIILAFLRNLINISYLSTLAPNKSQDAMEEMMLQLECRFVVGALIGVCLSWSITDALMGLQKQIIQSLFILAVALACCRFIMSYLSINDRSARSCNRSSWIQATSEMPIV